MSYNRLPALEAQPTQYRDEPETQADPEFDKFSEDLSTKVSYSDAPFHAKNAVTR